VSQANDRRSIDRATSATYAQSDAGKLNPESPDAAGKFEITI